ncbi:hypothetical protein [Streptomyces violaceusniger]|uniref:hypothetical protein n=1 Tax=Streptomyces violaceusniger TaxID=68280 RepID=UPI0010F784B7
MGSVIAQVRPVGRDYLFAAFAGVVIVDVSMEFATTAQTREMAEAIARMATRHGSGGHGDTAEKIMNDVFQQQPASGG